MISSAELQLAYNNLYIELRKYIWAVDVVELIADLDIQSYTDYPDMDSLKRSFRLLKSELLEVMQDDEDLKAAVDAYEDVLDSADTIYVKLHKVEEVVDHNEDSEEER